MKDNLLTRKQTRRGIATVLLFIVCFISGLWMLFGCTVQESLLVHNPRDYKVLSYEYPYATVEVVYDTTKVIETRFSLEPLAVGSYGISECRRVKK